MDWYLALVLGAGTGGYVCYGNRPVPATDATPANRVEWKYQLSLPTPRGRSEVRPEVGLPEAPLEREDD